MLKDLSEADKQVLTRAVTYYYKYVFDELSPVDNLKASEEDYALRSAYKKLELKLPAEITARF
ncbi:hypothetical protein [Vallitalea guaymasensis]|uniref:hypothetical protein n=1 Tax=Vallitalea guaymasensis TaxID=1185412 RepID=UPI000DE2ADB2|nr:hypothetical protein [Vallitalea guaymasensis]